MKSIRERLHETNSIFIYGAGDYGKSAYEVVTRMGLNQKIGLFIVSDRTNIGEYLGKPVIAVCDVKADKDAVVIIAVNEKYEKDIIENLANINMNNIIKLTEIIPTDDASDKADQFRILSDEQFTNILLAWSKIYRRNDLIEDIIPRFKNTNTKCNQKEMTLCIVIGNINARMARIICALHNNGVEIEIVEYRPLGRAEYAGNVELYNKGFEIYRCYSVEEALFEAERKSRGLCFIESPYGNAALAEIMLRFREYFGKIVFTAYDPYIGTYAPEDRRLFDSEMYSLENADGVVWRYYSKDFIGSQFGINYKGKSIHFPDCTEKFPISKKRNDDTLSLCCVPTHASDVLKEGKIENEFIREAYIDEIMECVRFNDKVRFDLYVWKVSDNEKRTLEKLSDKYAGFRFFVHVPHDVLMNRLSEYDYGLSLMTTGEIPSWPETNDGWHTVGTFKYAMSNKFFEFISAGVPVVSTFGQMQCEELEREGALIKMDLGNLDVGYLTKEKNG